MVTQNVPDDGDPTVRQGRVSDSEFLHEAFLGISQEILAGQNLADVLDGVVTAITRFSTFRRAALNLFHDPVEVDQIEQTHIARMAFAGLSDEEEAQLQAHPLPQANVKQLFQDRFRVSQSYYIPHDQIPWLEHPGLIAEPENVDDGEWRDDFLAIPMWSGKTLTGFISVDDPSDRRAPTVERLRPLELFANLAALAIEKTRKIRTIDRFRRRLQGIYRLSSALARAEDESTVLDQAMTILTEHFDYDYAALMLVEDGELALRGFHTELPNEELLIDPEDLSLPLDRGITGWVARHQEPLSVGDVSQDDRFIPGHPAIQSELAVPILDETATLGVLSIESAARQAFTDEDVELLQALADELGIVIQNLQYRRELEELATRDPLTGVYNRHHFAKMIEAERARAERYGFPISFVLIDYDAFHRINDRFGHLEGDRVLRETACFIAASVREVDTVIRYGGDEFLIVMPETSREAAQQACDRLQAQLKGADLGLATEVSVTLGVSTWYPEEGKSLETVLEEADRWMYRRKRAK